MAVYTKTTVALVSPLDLTALLAAGQSPSGTSGDSFVNTGFTYFLFMNNDGTNDKTVTFNELACNFGTDHDLAKTAAHNKAYLYGNFPVSEFGTSISVAYSGTGGVTNVKVAVLEIIPSA